MLSFKRFITEKRRNPEKNIRVEAMEVLLKYKNDPDVMIQFTNLNKMGVNPGQDWRTPFGIYAYPLKHSFQHYGTGIGNFPFAEDRKYILVMKVASDKVIKASEYTEKMYWADLDKLHGFRDFISPNKAIDELTKLSTAKIKDKQLKDFVSSIKQAAKTVKDQSGFPMTFYLLVKKDISLYIGPSDPIVDRITDIWKSLYKFASATNEVKKTRIWLSHLFFHTQKLSKNIRDWSAIFKRLGYMGFIDDEGGIIHVNEPIQAVFFSIKALKLIESINNVSRRYQGSVSLEDVITNIKDYKTPKYTTGLRGQKIFTVQNKDYEELVIGSKKLSSSAINHFIKKVAPSLDYGTRWWALMLDLFLDEFTESQKVKILAIMIEKSIEENTKYFAKSEDILSSALMLFLNELPTADWYETKHSLTQILNKHKDDKVFQDLLKKVKS